MITFVVHTCYGSGVCFMVCWFLSFVLCVAVVTESACLVLQESDGKMRLSGSSEASDILLIGCTNLFHLTHS
jgi:hypothetical protein